MKSSGVNVGKEKKVQMGSGRSACQRRGDYTVGDDIRGTVPGSFGRCSFEYGSLGQSGRIVTRRIAGTMVSDTTDGGEMKRLFPKKFGFLERHIVRMIAWQIGFYSVVALLLLLIWPHMLLGWLAGVGFNLVYSVVLANDARDTADKSDEERTKRLAATAGNRLFFSIVFMVFALKIEWLHFGAAVCGLLSLKIIYYFEGIGRVIKDKYF